MSCSGLFCHVFNLANSKLIPFVKSSLFYWIPHCLMRSQAMQFWCIFVLFTFFLLQHVPGVLIQWVAVANAVVCLQTFALFLRHWVCQWGSWSKRQNDVFTLQDFLQRWIVGSWWAESAWPAQRVFKRCACLLHADILPPALSSAMRVYENIASLHNYFIVVLMPYWSGFPPAHMHQNTSFCVMVTWKCKRRETFCLFSCKS